jgi:hypothetical protein
MTRAMCRYISEAVHARRRSHSPWPRVGPALRATSWSFVGQGSVRWFIARVADVEAGGTVRIMSPLSALQRPSFTPYGALGGRRPGIWPSSSPLGLLRRVNHGQLSVSCLAAAFSEACERAGWRRLYA